jgi:hypothetical protein
MGPKITVALMIGTQRERAGRCLESVLAQAGIEEAEVLLCDLFRDKFPLLPGSDHPSVRFVDLAEEMTYGEIRAYAVANARGEIIAYVEEHAAVLPAWLNVLTRDFALGYAGVGGVPASMNPGAGISDLVSMMNYLPWRRVTHPTEFGHLPSHNSAYRRDVLLSLGDDLPALLSSENLLGRQLEARGQKMLVDPAAQFLHQDEEEIGMILRSYYYWNILFGWSRARIDQWSLIRRLAQGLAIPLVPFVRLFKILVFLARNDRASLPLLFRSMGVILVANTSAAVGLARGCLFGAGDTGIRFLDYELNERRTREE